MEGIGKINLRDSYQLLTGHFAPKIIGEVNDVYVKIASIKGEDIPWHNHREEDELFFVVEQKTTLHTGEKKSAITRSIKQQK